VPYTEYYPPDTGAAALWLHNRDPKRWKRRTAPSDDPPPANAAEAEQKRRAAFNALMVIVEQRAREGKTPVFQRPATKVPSYPGGNAQWETALAIRTDRPAPCRR
jgi:hypothetical protein